MLKEKGLKITTKSLSKGFFLQGNVPRIVEYLLPSTEATEINY